jgi:two-component system, LuxR family, response regulator FixJ
MATMADGEASVFLVDRDGAPRQELADAIRALELPLSCFDSAEAFLSQFDVTHRGCLVVEAHLPGMDGVTLLEHLRRQGAEPAAIVVAAQAQFPLAVRALRAGAVNFLPRPCDRKMLWDALQEAMAIDAQRRPRTLQIARIRRRIQQLTAGERDVLTLLVDGKSNQEMAESLGISVRAVEVRRAKLLRKMKAASLAVLIRAVVLLELSDAASF